MAQASKAMGEDIKKKKDQEDRCSYAMAYHLLTNKDLPACGKITHKNQACSQCQQQPEFLIRLECTREIGSKDSHLARDQSICIFKLPSNARLAVFASEKEAQESLWGDNKSFKAADYVFSTDQEKLCVCLRCCEVCKKMEIKPVSSQNKHLFCPAEVQKSKDKSPQKLKRSELLLQQNQPKYQEMNQDKKQMLEGMQSQGKHQDHDQTSSGHSMQYLKAEADKKAMSAQRFELSEVDPLEKIAMELKEFSHTYELSAYKISVEQFTIWLRLCQKSGYMLPTHEGGTKADDITLLFWAETLKWAIKLWPSLHTNVKHIFVSMNKDLFVQTLSSWIKSPEYKKLKLNYTKNIEIRHLNYLFYLVTGKFDDISSISPVSFVQAIQCLLIPNHCTMPKVGDYSLPTDLAGALEFLYKALQGDKESRWHKFFRGAVSQSFVEDMMKMTQTPISQPISQKDALPAKFLLRLGEIRIWQEENEILAQGLSLIRTWNMENQEEWNHSIVMLQKSEHFAFVDQDYGLHNSLDVWLNLEPKDELFSSSIYIRKK